MAKKKQEAAKKKEGPGKYGAWQWYEVKGDSLERKRQWSPRKGAGFVLADHKDRKTCGSTGYTEFKSKKE